MPTFSQTSLDRLASCHPDLQKVMFRAIESTDFMVLCGHRGESDQTQAVRDGRSKVPWPKSKHNTMPSVAVDVAPYPIDWSDRERFAYLAGVIQAAADIMGIKIRWGNDWDGDGQMVPRDPDERLSDMPHFELVEAA